MLSNSNNSSIITNVIKVIKKLLVPKYSINNIPEENVATGSLIYNTSLNKINVYYENKWCNVSNSTFIQYISSPENTLGFARAVGISADSNTIVIGAEVGNNDVGSVWVYEKNGNVWEYQSGPLIGTGSTGIARHGYSVAISGDGNTIAESGVRNSNGSSFGSVWVYTRTGNIWTEQAGPLIPTGITNNNVGYSISLSYDGDVMVISSNLLDGLSESQGQLWIYNRSGIVWTQYSGPINGDAILTESLGRQLSLSHDGTAFVAGGGGYNNYLGKFRIYENIAGTWTETFSDTGLPNSAFGYGAAMSGDGNVVVVSAPYLTGEIGYFNIYLKSGEFWSLVQNNIQPSGSIYQSSISNFSGVRYVNLSYDGSTIVIGQRNNTDVPGGANIGAIYIFKRSGSVWEQYGNVITLPSYIYSGLIANSFGIQLGFSSLSNIIVSAQNGTNSGRSAPVLQIN